MYFMENYWPGFHVQPFIQFFLVGEQGAATVVVGSLKKKKKKDCLMFLLV